MIKAKVQSVSAERLKSFIERVEKLDEEQKAIGGDRRDVYAEAKGVGYDVKTMRRIVQLRRMDAAARDEAEALLDTYAHALGMVVANVSGSVGTEEEIDRRAEKLAREVDRCMALSNDDKPPKIAAIMQALTCSAGKASKVRGLIEGRLADGISFSPAPPIVVKNENEKPVTPPNEIGAEAEPEHAPKSDEHQTPAAREGLRLWTGTDDMGNPTAPTVPLGAGAEPSSAQRGARQDDDDLTIPEFLRGSRRRSHPDEREEGAA